MKQSRLSRPLSIGIYLNKKTKASREQVSGIFRFAGEHPEWELHLFTRPDSTAEMNRLTESLSPDGIIAGHPAILEAFRKRLRRHVPGVLIDFAHEGLSVPDALVICDDHAIGASAARSFVNRGYKSFAFAGITGGDGDSDAVNSLNRENGFRRTLRNFGLTCATYHETLAANGWRYTRTAELTQWLKSLAKPCALMAHSDLIAQSILAACRKARIPIPEQIAVIGVDNEESVCENSTPKISSIEPDFEGGGYRAAEILNRLVRHDVSRQESLRATYGILKTVERTSTLNVTGAHLRVDKARDIIRTRFSTGLTAAELAESLCISARMLEMLFLKTLGHTIRDELISTRLNEAKRLLTDTSLAFDDIASQCGFRTLSALKSIFKKRTGCSMRTYRTKIHRCASCHVNDM